MISACLVVIMVGTNKVSEYGITDDRRMVAAAELALLGLTVALNTYPYCRRGFTMAGAGVHAVPPVMIGVALMIHHAASVRYGLAIGKQAAELPDDALAPAVSAATRKSATSTSQDAYGPCAIPAPRLFGGYDAGLSPDAYWSRRLAASVSADLLGSARTRRTATGHIPNPIRPRPRAARVLYAPARLRPTNPEVRHAATGRQDASAHIRSTRPQTPDATTPGSEQRGLAVAAHSASGAGNRRARIDRERILRIAADHPGWSNRRIADVYGCSHSAVDKIFRVVPRPGV